MKLGVLAAVLAAIAALGVGPAPAAEGERRGSVPPGTSQDGSRPDQGAIKGGSIDRSKGPDAPSEGKQEARTEELERCRDLAGTLRNQCIADARRDQALQPPGP